MTRIEKNKPSAGTPRASLFGRFLAGGKKPLIDACYEGQERTRSNPHGIGQMAIVEVASQPLKPHAIIICERRRPEPLFVAGLIGVDRLLRVDFATGSKPATYASQALRNGLCDRQFAHTRTRVQKESLLRARLPAALGRAARRILRIAWLHFSFF